MSRPANRGPDAHPAPKRAARARIWRVAPLALIAAVTVTIMAMGWHRELSLETLVQHRATIDAFVATHWVTALAAYIGIYFVSVALSLPGATILTVAGGAVFGTVSAALAAMIGATAGATVLFFVAKTALGEWLARRGGSLAERLAGDFREDAFNYILFLRLVPLFPFWIINLVPALCGASVTHFVAATAIGIVPATFAFALLGAGLDSAVAAQNTAYEACLAAGHTDCRFDFNLEAAITPHLIAAVVVLGVIALLPIAIKRFKTYRGRSAG